MNTQSTPRYWKTRYGSVCTSQGGPDENGWITVTRVSDGAIREWNVEEMEEITESEALAKVQA